MNKEIIMYKFELIDFNLIKNIIFSQKITIVGIDNEN